MSLFSTFSGNTFPPNGALFKGTNVATLTSDTTIMNVSGSGIIIGLNFQFGASTTQITNFKITKDGGSERTITLNMSGGTETVNHVFFPIFESYSTSMLIKGNAVGSGTATAIAVYLEVS